MQANQINPSTVSGNQNAETQMIECSTEPHYNLMVGTPELAGQSFFSKDDKRLLPVYAIGRFHGKWSSSKITPPERRSRVRINFNGLGSGTVTGYFMESGWLGVYVALDKEPAWRKKQSASGKDAMVFGAEIDPI